jgi:hypothetical protein
MDRNLKREQRQRRTSLQAELVSQTLVIEPAQTSDDAALRELLRDTPMGTSIRVAFLREPNFFHATGIQGTRVQVFVGRLNGQVIGVGTRAVRPGYVNGRRTETGYLADLRLRPEYRGGFHVARAYRFLRDLHQDDPVDVYSTLIVEDNDVALRTIAANRAGLPRYTPLGRILTPAIHLRDARVAETRQDIVRGRPDLLPEIVAKLNENRLQFAPAYTEDDFTSGRLRDFMLEDFYVLRRRGRIAAVAGVWDQTSFRQTVVVRYCGWLGRLRPLVNLFRRPPLPAPGRPLKFFYLAFVAGDGVPAFAALLRRVANDFAAGDYTHFIVGLHERDPSLAALTDYAYTPFAGRLFAVTLDGPPELDDRVPYIEAALL